MVTFFSFLNDFLILMYNFLMFRTIFSIFSIISLIKVDVFILYCLDYSLCFSSETSTLISFGIIYSKKHSMLQSDGYPALCYIINVKMFMALYIQSIVRVLHFLQLNPVPLPNDQKPVLN